MIDIKSLFMKFFEDLDATQPQLDVKFSVCSVWTCACGYI